MVFATEMPLMSLVLYSQTHGCWKLTDFGSASQATSKRLNTTCFLRGTESYRSPEVLEHGRFNNRAHLFALGCIIFEIVTGRKRFSSDWAVLQYSQNENLRSSELWPRSPGQSHLHRLGRLTSFLLAADPKARPGAVETSRLLLDIHRGRDPVRESNGSASELDIFLEDAEKSTYPRQNSSKSNLHFDYIVSPSTSIRWVPSPEHSRTRSPNQSRDQVITILWTMVGLRRISCTRVKFSTPLNGIYDGLRTIPMVIAEPRQYVSIDFSSHS